MVATDLWPAFPRGDGMWARSPSRRRNAGGSKHPLTFVVIVVVAGVGDGRGGGVGFLGGALLFWMLVLGA